MIGKFYGGSMDGQTRNRATGWGLPSPAVLTLLDKSDAYYYVVGMRLAVGAQSMRWWARLWRWSARRNWRVDAINYRDGQLVLVRSR